MKLSTLIVVIIVAGVLFYLWESSGDDDGSDGDDTTGGIGNMTYTGNLIQTEEGENLTAYPDAGGYSIGYGHHGSDVTAGETITQDQADQYLENDIASAVAAVNKYVNVPLTQDQFNGIVDFVYNLGIGTVLKGSVFNLLNAGDFSAIPGKLEEYVYSSGKVLSSLLPRRVAEAAGFSDD